MKALTAGVLKVAAFSTLFAAQTCFGQDLAAEKQAKAKQPAKHAAVGSWFGRAVQLCADPNNAVTCPKFTIIMTPTIFADGAFTGVDHTAIGTAPLGPHTAAHGQWIESTPTTIVADYVFLSNALPTSSITTVGVSRFRWVSQVVDPNTMIGYINFYPSPNVPAVWENVTDATKFPPVPAESASLLVSPLGLLTDPKNCSGAACPLVFKFTVKRVAPGGWGF